MTAYLVPARYHGPFEAGAHKLTSMAKSNRSPPLLILDYGGTPINEESDSETALILNRTQAVMKGKKEGRSGAVEERGSARTGHLRVTRGNANRLSKRTQEKK
jgi:hypothetical protein